MRRSIRFLIALTVMGTALVVVGGCGTQASSASTQQPSRASTQQPTQSKPQTAATVNPAITSQEVKSINIKTSQGQDKVNQDINSTLKSLDTSLNNLDSSMGKLQ